MISLLICRLKFPNRQLNLINKESLKAKVNTVYPIKKKE